MHELIAGGLGMLGLHRPDPLQQIQSFHDAASTHPADLHVIRARSDVVAFRVVPFM